ncbi:MAG: FtsW/RodA/SpoVE family cell cycle protein [Syntrophomonadaceae bacterium]|jgi:cell division protein FtsW (lipid II flippase)|nr:FtsW/RodA/SpoVE family cell cycle protein [Syntrophomonadaceae bacterium]
MLNKFLDEVCSHIRCKMAHNDIRAELTAHIEEMQSAGKPIDEAIAAMGDCAEIGAKLDKQHKPLIEWPLIGLTAVIVIIGGIMAFTNDYVMNHSGSDFMRFLLFAVLGITAAAFFMFFNYTKLRDFTWIIYGAVWVIFIGSLIMGTRGNVSYVFLNWIFIAIPLLVAFAGFMDKLRGKGMNGLIISTLLALVSLIPAVLTARRAVIFLLVPFFIMLLAAVYKRHFGVNIKSQKAFLYSGLALTGLLVILSVIRNPYRFARMTDFITNVPEGNAWLISALRDAISSANWIGGADIVYSYAPSVAVPNLMADFALANVIITFGWLAGIVLVAAIIALIVRMFMITRKVKHDFGYYISLAACVMLSMQFVISVLMNLGMFPFMGVSLPFVSHGGTGYAANMVLVGLILSVWRRNNIIGKVPRENKNIQPLVEYADGKNNI